ncbi:MAG: prepilin peptidase [Acidobacteriota bacterium]|nr:prepilin peptidase [Acidobacteriota bacterium]
MTVDLSALPEAWVLLIVLGLAVGSFLNVCIYRMPHRLSLFRPGSRCPSCEAEIRWRHNVPILSWLWLRGQCVRCGTRISPRYPIVEALNTFMWVLVGLRFGLTLQTLLLLPFASAMIVLFFTDFDHKLLPNAVTLPLALLGLAVSPFNPRLDLGEGFLAGGSGLGRPIAAAVGAATGYGVLLALVLAWRVLFGREAMGGGDLKMMLGVGAFSGVHGVAITIFAASLGGTLLSLPLLLFRRWSTTRELPFGCFLAPAALLAVTYGSDIVGWYLDLVLAGRSF